MGHIPNKTHHRNPHRQASQIIEHVRQLNWGLHVVVVDANMLLIKWALNESAEQHTLEKT